jgi:hypothetical protein
MGVITDSSNSAVSNAIVEIKDTVKGITHSKTPRQIEFGLRLTF